MKFFIFITFIFLTTGSWATNLRDGYIQELKKVETIERRGNNKLYKLIRESSIELSKDWSPELAEALTVTFNKLLEKNPNYYVVELIEPVLLKKKKEFKPIFDKNLSKESKKTYERLRKIYERELAEGNG